MITEDDRLVFRKLGILLSLSVCLGLMVLIFFVLLSIDINNVTPTREIATMFCVFFTEIFACLLIFIVFTRQIKVKDKTYLRFFSFISMKMNKEIPKIKYPKRFTLIGKKLHNFYS